MWSAESYTFFDWFRLMIFWRLDTWITSPLTTFRFFVTKQTACILMLPWIWSKNMARISLRPLAAPCGSLFCLYHKQNFLMVLALPSFPLAPFLAGARRNCLTSELIISFCPISPTFNQLNFLSRATRALLHAASDGIVRKNKGYFCFFDKVGDVDP